MVDILHIYIYIYIYIYICMNVYILYFPYFFRFMLLINFTILLFFRLLPRLLSPDKSVGSNLSPIWSVSYFFDINAWELDGKIKCNHGQCFTRNEHEALQTTHPWMNVSILWPCDINFWLSTVNWSTSMQVSRSIQATYWTQQSDPQMVCFDPTVPKQRTAPTCMSSPVKKSLLEVRDISCQRKMEGCYLAATSPAWTANVAVWESSMLASDKQLRK